MHRAQAFPWGPIPPIRGKCPEGTKRVGTGGPAKRGRMRDREQSPFASQYDSAPRPSSASLRSAPSPRGRHFDAPPQAPAKRNFQRKFALRRFKTRHSPLGSKIVVNETKSNAVAKQKESAHVTVSTLLFLCTLSRELPGFQKGRSPFVYAARAAQQPQSNFFAAARHLASFRR